MYKEIFIPFCDSYEYSLKLYEFTNPQDILFSKMRYWPKKYFKSNRLVIQSEEKIKTFYPIVFCVNKDSQSSWDFLIVAAACVES